MVTTLLVVAVEREVLVETHQITQTLAMVVQDICGLMVVTTLVEVEDVPLVVVVQDLVEMVVVMVLLMEQILELLTQVVEVVDLIDHL